VLLHSKIISAMVIWRRGGGDMNMGTELGTIKENGEKEEG
jgi:hypothetical protein